MVRYVNLTLANHEKMLESPLLPQFQLLVRNIWLCCAPLLSQCLFFITSWENKNHPRCMWLQSCKNVYLVCLSVQFKLWKQIIRLFLYHKTNNLSTRHMEWCLNFLLPSPLSCNTLARNSLELRWILIRT